MQRDVIIIGGGLAGIMAAFSAQAEGAEVLLIDRGAIGVGTNSILAGGGFAAPTSTYDSDAYIKDTLQVGKMINSEPRVKLVAQEAPGAIDFLRSFGLDLIESSEHYFLKSPRNDVIPGVTLMKTLAEKIKDLHRVDILNSFYVTEILRQDNRVSGVRGLDKSGKKMAITAPSVVIATGGGGAIYLRNDNQKRMMGQGYYLAAKAGLGLWDMEFVQFYPLVMAEPRLPSMMLYPPYPKEAKIIDAWGEDIAIKYGMSDVTEAIMKKRDALSAVLFEEGSAGPIYMDYRKVPASRWKTYPLSLLTKKKFDFRTQPVAISPGAHFFMGGIRTDESGQTSLPGLFACGEVVWGLHGANRRGGNALTECLVLGTLAGKNAAVHSRYQDPTPLKPKESEASVTDISPADKNLRDLSRRLKEAAWKYAGVVRTEEGIKTGMTEVELLDRRLETNVPRGIPEIKLKEDLMSASFILKAILTASLARMESRGSFNRKDFPREDNVNWQKNSCLIYDRKKRGFLLSHHPVVAPIGK
jgi:succinate dehydrogenase/fumarate reductase flavoprotein subunit